MAQEPFVRRELTTENSASDERRGTDRPRSTSTSRVNRQSQPPAKRPQNRRPGGRFQPRRKVCLFCANKERSIDWKDIDTLRRFVGDNGQIFPRRKSGLCAKHQRHVAKAIKQARYIALLPHTSEHLRIMGKNY